MVTSVLFLFSAAEQRVKMSANERRREYLEEQTNEYENYLEEDRNGEIHFWLAEKQTNERLMIAFST